MKFVRGFARHLFGRVYVDEVFDCGDHLLVTNEDKEARIPFSIIRGVTWQARQPTHIKIHLREESILGKTFGFRPIAGWVGISRVAKELQDRANSVRPTRGQDSNKP